MRGPRVITLWLFLSGLAALPAWTQETPHLLADINHSPYVPFSFMVHEEPADFFNLGGRLFFSTADPGSLDPAILWSTDGTPGGTYLLDGDFDLGPHHQAFSMPGSGVLLIPTCASAPYCSLWRSDATRAGTGPFLGPDGLPFLSPQAFSFWRGRLYFVAVHGEGGESGLWSTDGTPPGTLFLHAVGEFEGRSTRTLATPSHLFFTAGDDGEDLWVTDGSPAGTIRVADFAPQLCAARAFFPAEDGAPGWELWESDGTFEGTRRVTDLAPGAFSSMPQIPSLAVANGFLFFSADDGKTGLEPWALPLAP